VASLPDSLQHSRVFSRAVNQQTGPRVSRPVSQVHYLRGNRPSNL
jgi:hypothetical protein